MIQHLHTKIREKIELHRVLGEETDIVISDRDTHLPSCRIQSRKSLADIGHRIRVFKLPSQLDHIMSHDLDILLCADRADLHRRPSLFAARRQHQSRQHHFEEPFHRSVGF